MREFILLIVVSGILYANAQMPSGMGAAGMGAAGMGGAGMVGAGLGRGMMAMGAAGAAGGMDMKKMLRTRVMMNMIQKTGKGSFFQNMMHVRTFCESGDFVMGEGIAGVMMADCNRMMGLKCMKRSTEKYGMPTFLKCQPNGLCCFDGIREKLLATSFAAQK
ncbi:uncharacterized protein LOC110455158 [Mizuhopecten yessoensis]|uniref:Uncharacterized protein n=1 Tax=Mizuhopecten yessoensis TaxID=6573 RepID=A0A210QDJ1_MIZYE|nr:uncharacterized protein LOC110455158 [Mizuhopecten yessoensis]OWF46806.1 hypothetical protein KP79_PYT22276 [Mizuhopecten yessoensis]